MEIKIYARKKISGKSNIATYWYLFLNTVTPFNKLHFYRLTFDKHFDVLTGLSKVQFT